MSGRRKTGDGRRQSPGGAERFCIFILFVSLLTSPVSRSFAAGQASAQFLKLGVGARYLAMGEAASAVADDVNALYWNPANLAYLEQGSLSLMYAAHVESVQYQYAGVAGPVEGVGALAAAIQTLSVGSLAETDDTGRELGAFLPRDFAGAVGWGRGLGETFSAGVAVKFVESRVLESASTLAADIGLGYRNDRLSAGLSARNLGGKLKFEREKQSLPAVVQAGTAYRFGRAWTLAVDGIFPDDAPSAVAVGTEYGLPALGRFDASVRAGYNTRLQDVPGFAGFSAGLGWRWSFLDVDYAWAALGELGQTHRASVTLRFGGEGSMRPSRS